MVIVASCVFMIIGVQLYLYGKELNKKLLKH